jgi:hypothetical protein
VVAQVSLPNVRLILVIIICDMEELAEYRQLSISKNTTWVAIMRFRCKKVDSRFVLRLGSIQCNEKGMYCNGSCITTNLLGHPSRATRRLVAVKGSL